MKTIVDEAVVLRHVDFRDSDRVITVFTREHGRLAGLARGVRRSTRRFAGRLDLFSHVSLSFRQGRGELYHFDSAELHTVFLGLRDDLYRLAWAGYVCELTQRIFGEHEAHPAAFDLLVQMLSYLSSVPLPEEGMLRALELRMLDEAGLLPELSACGRCGRGVDTGLAFRFVVTRGALSCERCGPASEGHDVPADVLGRLGASLELPLERLLEQHFSPEEGRGARELLTAFIRFHVGEGLRSGAMLKGLEPEPRRT